MGNPSKNKNPDIVIECNNLTKVYHKPWTRSTRHVCALKDVSLTIPKGQIVGLIGPNGAGKSTLLNLMAGLIHPTKGDIAFCGYPVRSIQAQQKFGFMPEYVTFPDLYSTQSILRYHGALLGLTRKEIALQIDKSIEQLQLHEFFDKPASQFSQGMKQRLALAIAMMNEPAVLLLDEPSNGLDPMSIIQLRSLFKKLRDSGTTIIISSHRLGELEKLTTHYIFIRRGRIIKFADTIEINTIGRLRIELMSDGSSIAEKLPPHPKLLAVNDTELVISISTREEIPVIIGKLVNVGARITGVVLQQDNIDDIFVRLCNERT